MEVRCGSKGDETLIVAENLTTTDLLKIKVEEDFGEHIVMYLTRNDVRKLRDHFNRLLEKW